VRSPLEVLMMRRDEGVFLIEIEVALDFEVGDGGCRVWRKSSG
jgi:hypothetical protein